MSVLVIDVGTSGVRAAVVRPDASVDALHYRRLPPASPFPGLVEFDAAEMARVVVELAEAALADGGPVGAVGVTTQRASTIVWNRRTGQPVGPGLGWQDLRTVMECITAKAEHGLALAPNQTATKAAWLLTNAAGRVEPADLCVGTVDSWLTYVLTNGDVHATDHTNAAVTGLTRADASAWNPQTCASLGVPIECLPHIVDSSGPVGHASRLPGSPPITALVGDQQGSLVGQACVRPGATKFTFGTGGMLDQVTATTAPASANRSEHGTFPIVAFSRGGALTWGTEAVMLSAGTNVDWLVDDMGMLADAAESHVVAAQCDSSDGVVYVPALLGLGTPYWDYGARGALVGLTRGSERRHIVRAVLEGVACRAADMVAAAEADSGLAITSLRVDGGMSQNPTFVAALANATQIPIEVSPLTEATTLGAAFLAGLEVGVWGSLDDIESTWRPSEMVAPTGTLDKNAWTRAVERASGWIPDLSALDF